MNIGNITPNNFNLNGVGKDIQIEVYEQLIGQLQQENKQLKDNWSKLKEDLINDINYWQEQEKEWIKLGFITFGGKANNKIIFKKVLDEMQELEQGSDNNDLLKENQELKKQLEATKKVAEENLKRWVIMKNQQKEFIKYLEDKKISPVKCVLNSIGDKNQDYNMFKNKLNTLKEILQKYKEIIGDDK